MRVVLVTLSGSAALARSQLAEKWPKAEIMDLPRSVLEAASLVERLRHVRKLRPDVFAVMTESFAWQFGKEALMYFGALAGAKTSVILDARGHIQLNHRPELLLRSPLRIAREYLEGRRTTKRATDRIEQLAKRPRQGTPELKRKGEIDIAYLRTTPSAGTVPGGATSHINGVINGLSELGANVRVISNDEIAGIDGQHTNFQKIEPRIGAMPRAAFDVANGLDFADQAAAVIIGKRPSFVYERYSRFSVAGVDASMKAAVPLFLEYNGSEVWVGTHWDQTARLDLLRQYEDLNLAVAARIFTVSAVEKNNLISAGIDGNKIVVNPNGVDVERFYPGVGGESERRSLGISPDGLVAGFVGTFGPWHGVLELAEAIVQAPRDPIIHYLFVGDGSLRAEMQHRLERAGLSDRATFTGSVPHDRVPGLLDACDILISPHVPLAAGAEFFGSPTKLFEYMAMGKAILASRLGQIGDVLADRKTALLVEPGNVEELTGGIQELATDAELRKSLGEAARRQACTHHTWTANARRILDEFEKLQSGEIV